MTAVGYQQQVEALAGSTDAGVQALYRQYLAGVLSRARFIELASQVIVSASSRAAALASAATVAQIASALRAVPPVLLVSQTAFSADRERLSDGLGQILDMEPNYVVEIEDEAQRRAAQIESTSSRLHRMAVDEPVEAAVRATEDSIERYRVETDVPIKGWRRRLDSNPCDLCRNWYGRGRVYRATTRFWRHGADQCVPELVIA